MELTLAIILGLILGSFANVCILRLPADQSITLSRSRCPHCHSAIRWYHNIPIVSFLYLKARCADCGAPISWQYPLVEAAVAGLFVLSALRFAGDPARILIFGLLSFYLLTISIIDYQHKIIPDELSLSLGVLGVCIAFWNPYLSRRSWPALVESGVSGLAGGALMLLLAWIGEKIFKKEALGGGDVKLMAAFGAYLGACGVLGSLVLGSFMGGLVGSGLLLLKRKKPGDAIPYGPFLCLGAFLVSLFPSSRCLFLFP